MIYLCIFKFLLHTYIRWVPLLSLPCKQKIRVKCKHADRRERFQLYSATALPTMISYWTLTCRTPLSLSLPLFCVLLELTKIAVPIVCIGAHTAHNCAVQRLASCCCNSLACVCVCICLSACVCVHGDDRKQRRQC